MCVTSRCTKQLLEACCTYVSTKTRPDIAYAVSSVARYCAKPTRDRWTAVKRILRYLKGTYNYMVLSTKRIHQLGSLGTQMPTGLAMLETGNQPLDIRMFLLGGAAISWKSSKQICVALSTAQVEYITLSAACQEAMWLQQLTSDLLNKRVHKKPPFLKTTSPPYAWQRISKYTEEPSMSTSNIISSVT